MEPLSIAVAGAVAGAAAGSLGTWMVARHRDDQRDAKAAGRALAEKVHQLELRMVKLEAEHRGFIAAGHREASQPGGRHA